MTLVTLDQAAEQLRLWEGAAAALARGRPYAINGREVSDPDLVRRTCLKWRRVCDALAARAKAEQERRWGGRAGQGRRVAGLSRRVR